MRRLAGGRAPGIALGALVLTAALALALAAPGPSPTVDSGIFELGPGVAADEGGTTNILGHPDEAGPDWTDIFDADGQVADLAGGVAAAFVADDLSQSGAVDDTTFSGAGGSNKNGQLISQWHWDTGNVPAKDDFSNAYSWATVSGGHLILYTGFERIAETGDSHVDIEFFQDNVALDEDPPCDDPGIDVSPCDFEGVRTSGDIVVSMDFTIGGTFGSISIREWDGSKYVVIGSLGSEGCNAADTICGFNNGAPINGGPWPNHDRHGFEVETLPTNAFTEFGVDVTAVAGGTPCITTMMGKTRSSQSFTAELKDFAGPVAFPVCALAWHKVDNVAEPLAGATFEVCRTHSFSAATGTFTDIPDECTTVVDNTDGDLDATDVDLDGRPGEFEIGGLLLGRYTIRETIPPPGFGADPDTVTVDFTGTSLRVEVGEAFVDERPIVKLTEFGYTNTPTGTPTHGVVSGVTVYTVRLRNFGGAAASVSGSVTVSVDGAGIFACSGTGVVGCTLSWSGVNLAPGADAVFSLTLTYSNLADGTEVRADLVSTYTTPPDTTFVREASGSPATVIFTVQAD